MRDAGLSFPGRVLPLLAALVCLLLLALCPASAMAAKQVFILNSYHPDYKWSADIMHGLEATLHQYDPEVLIHVEHMDTKRNLDPEYLANLPNFMELKYAFLRPDLVITVDESAFFFILEHGARIFPDTPVVFCGVNTNPLPPLPRNMTGVREYADLNTNVKLMRRLQPQMRKLMVISDKTATGVAAVAELHKVVPPDLPLQVLEDAPLPELMEQVKGIGPETGLLFLLYFQDRDGRVHGATEAISAISQASPVPVYGVWNFLMGHGLFGGYLTNGYEQGRIAGNMAGRILGGARPVDLPVTYDDGIQLEVDMRQMERFGITPDRLPPETKFLHPKRGTEHEILVLHSYHKGFKWTDDIESGIRESLGADAANVEMHVEYMDTKRHPEPEFTYLNYILMREKYRSAKFSAVLTSDDNAFNFARQYRQTLFNNAPIIFCGVNYLTDQQSLSAQGITGVLESYDIVSTVQAASRLLPRAKKLFVINDATPTGLGNHNRFEEVRHLLPASLDIELLENISMTRLLERLPTLPPDSFILLMSFNQDRDGNTFSYEESCKKIVSASPVPVFSFWDFYLGAGSIGGMVTSGRHQGLAAGNLLRNVLRGQDAGNLPIITISPNAFIFDAKAMKRHGMDFGLLPSGATLINDDSDAYRHTRALWTITALILIIAMLLGILVVFYRYQQRKRRALERSVRIDPLTGASTRSAFESEMPQKIKAAVEKNERFMFCYVDVDKLKQVNDTYGHLHGDTYLKEVVSIIRACVRASDEIYRIGGDEFVLIFPGCGPDEVQRVWNKVLILIDAANNSGRIPYTMGVTHGCTAFNPQEPQDLATLLKKADQSMYTRKNIHTS
ncbi:diguanylate cyclase (GGDEF) domain-containing protein [Desulfomicrobium norvegicum]|uniref:diguanylate cyclase n=1 Tax=Desulfomicrobium norvegicum (strain DSM 1741 / NCIMB 8310) TaxID=52561 RepID=A0A8G2F927_DESNO|nr:ABC transporter substrate binding protein [Desulfomicrobium norvegicum]SFM21192.1 diguanylate cyclase (GGDEF) domain-containing protein [Desulfomicrobium norvegicum]